MNLFGTDGIRGTYGSTLNDGTAFLLGKSLALLSECPIVVIARDTRTSGAALFSALSKGVYAGGGNVINLGVLPTNAVGHFVRKLGGDYGVMITASHNPPDDNGLKVFDRYGVKMCASKQLVVSRMMSSLREETVSSVKVFEPVFYDIDNIYAEDVIRAVGVKLDRLNVALDCCYGSAYKVAPLIFTKAGANVTAYCNQNDGDRLAVFEGKKFVSNNRIFYAVAKYLREEGRLAHNTVCGTVLTNGGVEQALGKLGVKLVRSGVGDINVFNRMVQDGLNFGGEESGHYLLCDLATTSDAIVNALFVCKIYQERGSILAYTAECVDAPSVSANIALTDANARLSTNEGLSACANRISSLYPNCRIVLRKSGTENKIRAYLEGDNVEDAMKLVVATFAQEPRK